jgi:enterochelin esterase-like enzyme
VEKGTINMRSLISVPRFLALSAGLLLSTSLLYAQAGNAAPNAQTAAPATAMDPQGAAQAPQARAASAPAAGRAEQMQLSSATPLAETENLDVYPAAPEGFNIARDNIPHGEVKVVEYDSKTLGLRRMLRVYTPPGYTPDRKFPVLYLHHGLGNTSTEWTQRARTPIIVDNLLADKKIQQPFIIVFPSGNATATMADEKQGDRTQESYGSRYQDDLLKEIIPFVESRYSVYTDRNHRAIAGDVDGRRPDIEHWPDQPRQVRLDRLRCRRPEHSAAGRTHYRSVGPQAAEAAVALCRQPGQPVPCQ